MNTAWEVLDDLDIFHRAGFYHRYAGCRVTTFGNAINKWQYPRKAGCGWSFGESQPATAGPACIPMIQRRARANCVARHFQWAAAWKVDSLGADQRSLNCNSAGLALSLTTRYVSRVTGLAPQGLGATEAEANSRSNARPAHPLRQPARTIKPEPLGATLIQRTRFGWLLIPPPPTERRPQGHDMPDHGSLAKLVVGGRWSGPLAESFQIRGEYE